MGKSKVTFEASRFLGSIGVGVSDIRKTYSGNNARKISNAIGEAVKEVAAAKTFEMAVQAAKDASEWITPEAMPFHNITGNLYRSMGFLITRYDTKKGRAMRNRTVTPATINHAKPATRLSLRRGEMYKLPKNYLGDLSGYSEHFSNDDYKMAKELSVQTPFVGRVGGGNYSGNEMRKRAIQEFTGQNVGKFGETLWRCYAFVAMPYTKHVEAVHNIRLGVMMADMYKQMLKGNFGIG